MKPFPTKPFAPGEEGTIVSVIESSRPDLGLFVWNEGSRPIQKCAVRWTVFVDGEPFFESFSEALALMIARAIISNAVKDR